MNTIYTWCAVLGGTMLIGQFLLSLLGIGSDGDELDSDGLEGDGGFEQDFDGQGAGAWFVGMLSARAILSAATIFGLAGLAALKHYDAGLAFSIASAAGLGVLFAVGWLMKTFTTFASDGTVRIEQSLGATGTVYLPIPGQKGGRGKVTVHVNQRSIEYAAVTAAEPLPTGTPIVVVDVPSHNVVEVARAE